MSKLQGRNLVGLFVALALAAGSASATNGYYTTGTGTKSKAQAGAGSANPQELMSLATNPAGIAFVPDSIDAGLSIFSPMRDYETSPSLRRRLLQRRRVHHRPERPRQRERVLPDPLRRHELEALSDVDYLALPPSMRAAA